MKILIAVELDLENLNEIKEEMEFICKEIEEDNPLVKNVVWTSEINDVLFPKRND